MDDLLLRGGLVAGQPRDMAIRDGRIRLIAPRIDTEATEILEIQGHLVVPGFVESHIHPDKAFIADRAPGLQSGGPTPQTLVAELKKAFTVDDIRQRASRVLEIALRHGCTAMRAYVEIDDYVRLRGVEAMLQVQQAWSGLVDLQLVAFAQEGIYHDDVTCDLLREGLRMGLPTLGGCPYMDTDQKGHIDWFFETAAAFGVRLDFHADSSDDPAMLTCDYIAEQTIAYGMQGQVTLGHLSTLDTLEPAHRADVIAKLHEAGVHAMSLPATESHVKGRDDTRRTWRGVTRIGELRQAGLNVSLSTNNIVNPFTPYGHPDLLRQALVAAMTAHLGNLEQMAWLLDLVTVNPAHALGLSDYGLDEGCRADLVVLDAATPAQAITEQAEKLWVCKDGRIVVRNSRATQWPLRQP
jgi:cytosine deaminase